MSRVGVNKWLKSDWAVAGLIGLITFIILSGVLLFHFTTFQTNLDNVNQYYTWYQKLAIAVHHGYLPIWNSNINGGESFAGEIQTGVFYPINILFVWLFGNAHGVSQTAIDYLVALHFAVAVFGIYLLTKIMGVRRWVALLSGVVFAFSGVVAFRAISQISIFYGLALLPYPLYLLLKFHVDNKKRWLVWGGVSLGLVLLSGHIQPFYHCTLALVILEIALIKNGYKNFALLKTQITRSVKCFLLMFVCAFIVMLPQLWVSVPYLSNSYRVEAAGYSGPGEKISYSVFSKAFSFDIHDFANLIDPVSYPVRDGNNIFIGLVPLTIITAVIILARKQLKETIYWRKYSYFIGTLLVFSTLAMLGYLTWFAAFLYKLPLVYQIRQLARYSILFDVALVLSFAGSFEIFTNLKLTAKQKLYVAAAGLFMFINGIYLFLLRSHVLSLHNALQTGLLGLALLALAGLSKTPTRRAVIILLLLITAYVNTLWYLPKLQSDVQVPSEYKLSPALVNALEQTNGKYRVGIVNNAIPINVGNVYNVQTIGGYSATVYAPYYRFINDHNISQATIQDLLGVQLLATTQKPVPGEVGAAYGDAYNPIYLLKRPTALPKIFLSNKLGSLDRNDYQGVNVSTLSYGDNVQKYRVNLTNNSTAIISEVYYKGWSAKIDGQNATLKPYIIDGIPIFKSLNIPAGLHTVQLEYKPFGFFVN